MFLNEISFDRRVYDGSQAGTTGTAAQIAARKANETKDLNIDDRIDKFQDKLKNEYVYRIPLKYFTDLGKLNFPLKIDIRIKCHHETKMKKLFESVKVLAANAAIPAPDAKIIFTKSPFIQYEQMLLDKNFRQYLKTIMVSKQILRMDAQRTPTQKTCETNVGQDSLDTEVFGLQRQIDWLELSLIIDKSDKHTTIYDSYNTELAAKTTKYVKLSNFT